MKTWLCQTFLDCKKSAFQLHCTIIVGRWVIPYKLGANFVKFLVSLLHVLKPTCVFVALGKDANSGVRLF